MHSDTGATNQSMPAELHTRTGTRLPPNGLRYRVPGFPRSAPTVPIVPDEPNVSNPAVLVPAPIDLDYEQLLDELENDPVKIHSGENERPVPEERGEKNVTDCSSPQAHDITEVNQASISTTQLIDAVRALGLDRQDHLIWGRLTPAALKKWLLRTTQDAEFVFLADEDQLSGPQLLLESPRSLKDRIGKRVMVMARKSKFVNRLEMEQGYLFYRAAVFAVMTDPAAYLGDLVFESRLGLGAFGVALKVHHKHGGQSECVKISALTQKAAEECGLKYAQPLDEARKELDKMMKLHSNDVVALRSYGSVQKIELMYAVMELCAGGDLGSRYSPKSINLRGAVLESAMWRWITDCVAGVRALHKANIIHRDLKPEVLTGYLLSFFARFSHSQIVHPMFFLAQNILLSSSDDTTARCKVGDLGLAKDTGHDQVDAEKQHSVCGTAKYMAPEVIANEPYSAKCDVWSLGLIFFQMVANFKENAHGWATKSEDDYFSVLVEGRGKRVAVAALKVRYHKPNMTKDVNYRN
jgi:hypothetical protein